MIAGKNLIFVDTQKFENSIIEREYNLYEVTIDSIGTTIDKAVLDNKNTLFVISGRDKVEEQIYKIKSFLSKISKLVKPFILVLIDDKTKPEIAHESVFYISEKADETTLLTSLSLIFEKMLCHIRIDDYIIKSFNIIVNNNIIERQKDEIQLLYSDLEKMSKIDPLTQILNRKAFFEALESEKKRTLRGIKRIEDYKSKGNEGVHLEEHFGKFACIMIDIDHFKDINDKYGHLIGDKVLRKIGDIMKNYSIFRDNDIIGRFGGEEFIVILPATGSKNAVIPARRFSDAVRNEVFSCKENANIKVTISIGISEFVSDDEKTESLIDRADKALYYAKEHGRDMIAVYEDIFKE